MKNKIKESRKEKYEEDKLEKLIKRSKAKGSISYDEFLEELPKNLLIEKGIEYIIDIFSKKGIKVEEEDTVSFPKESKEQEIILNNLSAYIKDVSNLKIMDRDEELLNAKRKEIYEKNTLISILRIPHVIKKVIEKSDEKKINFKREEYIQSNLETVSKIISKKKRSKNAERRCAVLIYETKPKFKDVIELFEESKEEIKKDKKISLEYIKRIEERKNRYLQARDNLIESNLRWVINIANKNKHKGLELHDIIQEGNAGLIIAVDKFDWRRGYRLNTYASWWIKQSIGRAFNNNLTTIRIPIAAYGEIIKIKVAQKKLTQKLEREPSIEEITEETNINPDNVKKYIKAAKKSLSLDALNNPRDFEGHGSELINIIQKDDNVSTFVSEEYWDNKEDLEKYLAKLNKRECGIIMRRYNLPPYDDGESWTLEKVGKVYGVTRERIRQIETKALKKLQRAVGIEKSENHRRSKNIYLKKIS